jgi:predicted alpha-1,6-mannanase (GH76 family)
MAERTVTAVLSGVTTDGVINSHGGGDGGLFAAILARYLAMAAARLGRSAGGAAGRLVYSSAESAWRNRGAGPGGPLFGPDWSKPAVAPKSIGDRRPERDLSVQIAGWMVLEAAAGLERA